MARKKIRGKAGVKFKSPYTSEKRDSQLRTLVTHLIINEEVKVTETTAKSVVSLASKMITFAKKGDLHSRRQALKYIYDRETGKYMDVETNEVFDEKQEGKKLTEETVLRKLFAQIGKKYESRNGGYTKIFRLAPRRGDAVDMALIQLV